ncbi:MAG TPA: hypothetical protein DEB30_02805 [Candidatus Peribacter riflensis]|uniref:Uncharacterized protein n=1 Tax=Candidatus Peribacter riflensis TaxID=1735162 RepID=A0A0S1SQL3_9BACT|nr:MAG: hypothetical protein PeribacterA2_0574 [Candidatus Peribacter riflensis]OGJ77102.1 MAG: hypothetical protein A2398_03205 [Candidatus Peribacteria bacterium RIFOXYB1_FULL_57_12]OGJ79037.1 MAG: hypothetical protein A2412_00570 [Candidatus Peribacteria bacterium RIFOXYC1_FULL_58_8]ALM11052.1 MAG: hypothetical protein PeribacterB2_0573 [Candidatus Peribacter riflensis]ALM12155.1 MAG: hypothetical protein PeribacterC2_0573 [Candidatus Peribacter riflensis]
MDSAEAERRPPGSCDPWGTVIVQWIRQLSPTEQKALSAQWFLRRRQDARKKLEELFHAEVIDRLYEKVCVLGGRLGGEFADSEQVLLSQLFLYMMGIIPDRIRDETKLLVDAVLRGRPIVRADM